MPGVSVKVLGAGGEVGRSCFLVTIDGLSVLLDSGVHLSPESTADRVPSIPPGINIVAIIITHYHLDHIGALPYLLETSRCGSLRDCPVYMTVPTSLLAPPILTDYCRSGPNSDLYTSNHVTNCFERIIPLPLNTETYLMGDRQLSVTSYHSGHVVGGVGLLLKRHGLSVVYTGDFSVVQDALLKPVQIPQLTLPIGGTDLVISEATHATRVSERSITTSEKELCSRIKSALERGGKVLIPIFAVGRTQEIASIIRAHLGSEPRLYTTSRSGKKASVITQSIARSWSVYRDSNEVHDLDVQFLSEVSILPIGPCVIFSSPAMLEGGASLDLFRRLCVHVNNLVIMTGYCSQDTLGNSVILFASKKFTSREIVVHGAPIRVNCECAYIPFSNHSDSPGIESVIRGFVPRNIILVHGEKTKMESLRNKVVHTWAGDVEIYIPQNGTDVQCDRSINPSCNNRKHIMCPFTIRRKVAAKCSDFDGVFQALSKSSKEIEATLLGNQIVVRTDAASISLCFVPGTTELFAEYVSEARNQSAEWVTYNRIFILIKDTLSSMNEDDFSISECS